MIHSNNLKLSVFRYLKPVVAIFSLCIAIGLLVWSLGNYQPAPNIYGPRAIYSLIFLSILLSLLGRILLLRLFRLESAKQEIVPNHMRVISRSLFLIDITAPC